MATTNSYEYSPRDLVGYGEHVPNANWPNGAKVAISLVLNYEEGCEVSPVFLSFPFRSLSPLSFSPSNSRADLPLLLIAEQLAPSNGDSITETGCSEIGPGLKPMQDQRDVNMESVYEYGSRSGVWSGGSFSPPFAPFRSLQLAQSSPIHRIFRLFSDQGVPCTAYACGKALELAPKVAEAFGTLGHEVASHGYRWVDRTQQSAEEELENVKKAIRGELSLAGGTREKRALIRTSSNSHQGYFADWYASRRMVLWSHRVRGWSSFAWSRCAWLQGGGNSSQVSSAMRFGARSIES